MNIERKLRLPPDSILGRLVAFLARFRNRLVAPRTEHAEDDTDEFEPLTPEQHAVIARAEPLERGRVIESLLPDEQTFDVAQRVRDMPIDEISAAFNDIESPDEAALKAEAVVRAEHLGNVLIRRNSHFHAGRICNRDAGHPFHEMNMTMSMGRFIAAMLKDPERSRTVLAVAAAIGGLLAVGLGIAAECLK